jgi:1-acyl-sn-glycerol-3-phosphate acyltransferase
MANQRKDTREAREARQIERHIERALATPTPRGLEFEANYRLVRQLFKPLLFGSENIPQKPCLFVGNHSLFALDGMVLVPVMQKELGRFLRPMGDRFLFTVPAVEKQIMKGGSVVGHPDVCAALMEHGSDLLVFPGGAHESVKPKSELYKLQWKERYGFVKLAAKYGYTIVPVAMVGPDEFFDHYMESDELRSSRLVQLLQRLGMITDDTRADMFPPIPKGVFGSWIPKPQRCYIGFGQPVDLAALKGKRLTKTKLQSIRQQVASEIEEQLEQLLQAREEYRGDDGLLRRLLTR